MPFVALLLLLPAMAAAAPPPAPAAAPLESLVGQVDIPFESFTLPNGLRVVVHTDRKAPLVAVGVWYHVGSKDEPLGKSGYAHLFEHLMFYGSEHSPGQHFAPLEAVGATDFNGTTSFDRTNYFQTVPTPALDLALFLESDRMGWLLPALDQKKLDAQRKVVLNEKRQGENEPYGMVGDALLAALFPPDNPYQQSSIGRTADLEKATLADAADWFRTHYGPNNAVLVLAGDIDATTARPMVEKWFGRIPPGPTPARFAAPIPARAATTRQTLHDRIATPRLIRAWAVPGRLDPEQVPLAVALAVFADGPASRLYQALVRDEKLAVSVSGGADGYEQAGIASIAVDLAPGADPATVERRIDALLAAFLRDGPTADEVGRVAMRAVSGTIFGLEKVGGFGGKGATLAEGMLYAGDPALWRRELRAYAEATPAYVAAAARRWLGAGDHRLTLLPGNREAMPDPPTAPRQVLSPAKPPAPWTPVGAEADRSRPPAAGPALSFHLPPVERATLANGMRLMVVPRPGLPVLRLALLFPVGVAGDSAAKPGTEALMLAMTDEGSNGRLGPLDGPEIARRLERLGGAVSATASLDRTRFGMATLSVNLDPMLGLFADMVRAPAFPADQFERVRAQALTGLRAEAADPAALAYRLLPPLLYGNQHPYGRSFTGNGTAAGLTGATIDDLRRFHAGLDPARATLIVVGDTRLAALEPRLAAAFADWTAASPAAIVASSAPPAPAAPGVLLVDRPGSAQAVVLGGAALGRSGRDDILALKLANDVFGGLTSSRLFQELRERNGWSYGASSGVSETVGPMPFLVQAAVDPAHVGDSIAAIRRLLGAQKGAEPPTPGEIATARANAIRGLPGELETGYALLRALERNDGLGRPDTYLPTLPLRIAAVPEKAVAAAPLPDPAQLGFVIVGDAAKIRPQLSALGLPVAERPAAAADDDDAPLPPAPRRR